MFTKHSECREGSTSGLPPASPARTRGLPSSALPLSLSAPRVPPQAQLSPRSPGQLPHFWEPPYCGRHTVCGMPGHCSCYVRVIPCLTPLSPQPCAGCPLFPAGCLVPMVRYPGLQLLPLLRRWPPRPVEAHLLSHSLGGYSHQSSWCSRHHQTWRRAHLSIALSQVPTWQHPGQHLPHPPYLVLIWTVQGP